MGKQPFDVNRDLGVPKVDWNKVNTSGEGPKRYPSETDRELTPDEIDTEVVAWALEQNAPIHLVTESKPLEEPIGETPKFNPVTKQFELPE